MSRTHTLIKNILGSGASRALNLVLTLLFVPIALRALGPEGYSQIAAAISIALLLIYADLGLGASLVNKIATSGEVVLSDSPAHQAVSTVWYVLIATSFFLTAVFCALYWYSDDDSGKLAFLAVGIITFGIPFGLYQRILFALQRNVEANAWLSIGRIAGLASIAMLHYKSLATPTTFLIGFLGLPVLINLLATKRTLFGGVIEKPYLSHFSIHEAKQSLKLGLSFVALQLVPYAESGMDNALLGSLGFKPMILAYDVHLKLFLYIPTAVSIAAFPLWPAVAKAISENDGIWLERIKKVAFIYAPLISTFGAACIVIFRHEIVFAWTSEQIYISTPLALAMGAIAIGTSYSLLQAMWLNAHGMITAQTKFYIIYLPILFVIKATLLHSAGPTEMASATAALIFARCIYLGLRLQPKSKKL